MKKQFQGLRFFAFLLVYSAHAAAFRWIDFNDYAGGGWAAVPTSKPGLANPAYRMGTAVAKGRNKDYAFIVARPCIHLNSVFSR